MVKAVFIASSHTDYDDRPGETYHFPNRNYLKAVAQTVGDWVIFYEGRRGGGRGYYGVQRVEKIVPDPVSQDHSYAILDRASQLSFERNVQRLRPDSTPYETGLPASGGSNTSAVRLISDDDFAAIVSEGLRANDKTPESIPRTGSRIPSESVAGIGFAESQSLFHHAHDVEALRQRVLTSRAFRDASFARQVKRAYGARCAMSGLALRNGGGRPEVEAAHIIPVEKNGPDIVPNGLALSGTVHWMFDRGLVSVDEDRSILVANGTVATDVAERLLTPNRKLIGPSDPYFAPLSGYLKWHRENVFKG